MVFPSMVFGVGIGKADDTSVHVARSGQVPPDGGASGGIAYLPRGDTDYVVIATVAGFIDENGSRARTGSDYRAQFEDADNLGRVIGIMPAHAGRDGDAPGTQRSLGWVNGGPVGGTMINA